MKRKLLTGMIAGALLVPLMETPAPAGNKSLAAFIHGGAPFDAHDVSDKYSYQYGCDGKTKKHCPPWVNLRDGWPLPFHSPGWTNEVGGHFHKWFVDDEGTPWDQEVNLVESNSKAYTSIVYGPYPAGCQAGYAYGTLALQYKEEAEIVSPLLKSHNQPIKDEALFYIDYFRLGATAIVVANNQKKTGAIIASLIFHPKEPLAATAYRCTFTNLEAPLKVYFDVLGIYISG